MFCDGTGDGDVAASAGAEFTTGLTRDNQSFAMTQLIRLSHVDWERVLEYSTKDPGFDGAIRRAKEELPYYTPRTRDMIPYWGHPRPELARLWYEDGALMWGGTVVDVDGLNVDDLTRAEVEGRRQVKEIYELIKENIPGCEKAILIDSGAQIGLRETRRITGKYVLTEEDIVSCKSFEDAIASYAYPLDIHNPTGTDTIFREIRGEAYQIPYRSLLPREEEQVLVAGRCISTTHEAMAAIRVMPCCFALGEAAGTAAALSLRNKCLPSQLDPQELQETLKKHGAYIGRGEEQ